MTKVERPERLDTEKLEALKELFPQVFSDGKINFEALREELADEVEELAPGDEHYGLSWPGKREAKRLASKGPTGTLRPVPGEGVNEDTTKNLIIEGDNLEVLRIMQKAYAGRIKMIYIDPPYNTGNDFVYKDDFREPVERYLEQTAQSDDFGLLTSNPASGGRYHSNWLNMIYPRLRLAKNLLTPDGAIFVSIDDNELANLRHVMDAIFGEENYISTFIWKSRQNKDNRNFTNVSMDHEYIICYGSKLRGDKRDQTQYANPDNDSRGPWTSANMVGLQPEQNRPNLHYTLVDPDTGIEYPKPEKGWRYDRHTMGRLISESRILWPKDPSGRPRRKVFLNELEGEYTGFSSIIGEGLHTRDGTADVERLFGVKVMDFPKPVELMEAIVEQGMEGSDGTVLDFFAGSGTTAESVLRINDRENRDIKYILIQIPELTSQGSAAKQLGISTMSNLLLERVRRAITSQESKQGFKFLKLAQSNIRSQSDILSEGSISQHSLFDDATGALVQDSTPWPITVELMLLEGYPLDSEVTEFSNFTSNNVTKVQHPDQDTKLLICLDETIKPETITEAGDYIKTTFICLDSALSDEAKLQLDDKITLKTL